MRKEWNFLLQSLTILIGLLWLQVVAPPWLALFGLLIWFRNEVWYLRVSILLSLGLLWSVSAGVSPVWGMLTLALLLWGDKTLRKFMHDKRWRIWIASGSASIFWAEVADVSWSAGVLLWWLAQGVLAWFLLRFLKKKAL